ncbi:hypothetical protein HY479_02170 [Candidatus Uhrbacteria bacterium]|nr:hypothetical protein [Candidatus Uhrbacteria bacterium]
MSRSFSLAMTRPHERFGLPQPIGRRLPHGMAGWNALLISVTVALTLAYIIQVNKAAARGFQLRDVEKKIETVNAEVMRLEDKLATLSSVQALTDRAKSLGFQPAERIEFVNPAANAYALAR